MALLLFAPEADELLTELEATPTRVGLLREINTALDLLERDPSDVRCRRRRFSNIGCWAIAVEAEGTQWLLLWEEGEEDAVVVRANVPSP